jgi:RNA polymerase sigma-70 factor, ECF subfamily
MTMAATQFTDAYLVEQYVSGNEKALELLIKRHESKIFGFIYSKITDRDLANDIFQDTFIKVIRTLKSTSYNEEGKFLPCVLRTTSLLIILEETKKCRYTERQKIFLSFLSCLMIL